MSVEYDGRILCGELIYIGWNAGGCFPLSNLAGRHDLTVHFIHTLTGERYVYESEDATFYRYWWSEGSASCDCNRLDWCGLSDIDDDDDDDTICSSGRILIEKIVPTAHPHIILYTETMPEHPNYYGQEAECTVGPIGIAWVSQLPK